MRVLAVVAFAVCIASGWVAAQSYEQVIEPLDPTIEQRVETVGEGQEQRVDGVEPGQEQAVGEHVPPTPTAKAASRVGKFFLGVTAAVLALGVMAAELIFI